MADKKDSVNTFMATDLQSLCAYKLIVYVIYNIIYVTHYIYYMEIIYDILKPR